MAERLTAATSPASFGERGDVHFMANKGDDFSMGARTIVLLLAACLLAVAGCAQSITNYASPQHAALQIGENRGRIILSAGSPAACLIEEHELVVSRRGSLLSGATIFANAIQIRSDYDTHFGTLNVLQLQAGDYVVRSRGGGSVEASFTLAPGETLYLGEIFLTQGCTGRASPAIIRDQWDRDIAIIRERNPALADQPITKRILVWTPIS